jgi:3'-phosphoadenosine 5'-phosphosulfate sulfotransferase (PAPS reductase)/FAD synthetase
VGEIMKNDQNNIVSLSGGKDSTAMIEMMIERGEKIHSVIYCDMGTWEFPAMHDHIKAVEKSIGIPIVRVKPKWDPVYMLTKKPVIKRGSKEVYRLGNNWPSAMRRWCTREKMNALHRYIKSVPNAVSCVGLAAGEEDRLKSSEAASRKITCRYPLMEYGVTESEALQYCYFKSYTWDDLYELFGRVSCFCCPLQPLGELRKLRRFFPDLWSQMLDWDSQIDTSWGAGFKGYRTVHDLENRFSEEDRQGDLFPEMELV